MSTGGLAVDNKARPTRGLLLVFALAWGAAPSAGAETSTKGEVTIEATILAYDAAESAAAELADVVSAALSDHKLQGASVVVTASERVPQDVAAFRKAVTELEALAKAYEKLAESARCGRRTPSGRPADRSLAGGAEEAEALEKILGILETDTVIEGVEVTLTDEAVRALVAGALVKHRNIGAVIIPELWVDNGSSSLESALQSLKEARSKAQATAKREDWVGEMDRLAARLSNLRDATPAADRRLLEDVRREHSCFAKKVGSLENLEVRHKEKTKPERLASLRRLAPLAEHLADDRKVVILQVRPVGAGGNNRVTDNLFTKVFSRDRLSHAGGALISYTLAYPKTGVVLAAGNVDAYTSYQKHLSFAKGR